MTGRRARGLALAVTLLSVGALRADETKLDPERPSGTVPLQMDHLEQYTTGMLISYLESIRNGGATAQDDAARVASYLSQTDPNWRVTAARTMAKATTAKVSARLRKTDDGSGPTTTASVAPPPTPTPTPSRKVTPTSGGSPTFTPAAAQTGPEPVMTPTPVPTRLPAGSSGSGAGTPDAGGVPAGVPVTPASTAGKFKGDWYAFSQSQMQSFYAADRDIPGAAPKGFIFDPKSGALVKLDDHQKSVGMFNAFSDEIANTSSGRPSGTVKRIKDQ